jgi:ElaB/YqjD/DUF883 family membrane-anchored ribosome-binding protein
MNDKKFEDKVERDIEQTKKDITSLGETNIAWAAKIKTDLAALGEDGLTGLNRKFEQLTGDTKEMVADTLETVNKDVGQKLSEYNAKVQDAADRFPGDLGKKAAVYPWVTITASLALGLLLGLILKPGRRPVRQP